MSNSRRMVEILQEYILESYKEYKAGRKEAWEHCKDISMKIVSLRDMLEDDVEEMVEKIGKMVDGLEYI